MKAIFADMITRMSKSRETGTVRSHLRTQTWPGVVYAVGDVHGCNIQLRALEASIQRDAAVFDDPKLIVYLGDYVDRGPDSSAVLDHLLSPPPAGFSRICLAGNHEAMMLDYIRAEADSLWIKLGGAATLRSYGIDPVTLDRLSRRNRQAVLDRYIPQNHVDFLQQCVLSMSLPGVVFVHAGIRPGISINRQQESDLLWIRDEFLNADLQGDLIVHGHTPSENVVILPHRIGVDTGAYSTGLLSAVRLTRGGEPFVLGSRDQGPP